MHILKLRDDFAKSALQGLLSGKPNPPKEYLMEMFTSESYKYADLMISERNKPK